MAKSKAHKAAVKAARERAAFRSSKRALIHKIDSALDRLQPDPMDFAPGGDTYMSETLTGTEGPLAGALARALISLILFLGLLGMWAQATGC